jgi:hypothetical protein
MLDEYDFRGGERGRYAARYEEGSKVVVLDRPQMGEAPMAESKFGVDDLVSDFGSGLVLADSRRPVAENTRTGFASALGSDPSPRQRPPA